MEPSHPDDAPRPASTGADTEAAGPLQLPTAARKRVAEEWAFVLVAEGIDARVVRREAGFGVEVPLADRVAACASIASWEEERRERRARRAVPPAPVASRFELALAYALALGLLAFHAGLDLSGRASAFVERGESQAVHVLGGELWRLVTALTLHADLPHVVGNTLFGGLFLAALAGRLGMGLSLLAFVITGALGNLANALYYGSAHSSIGASTGVFGLVGVLAGLAAWQRHQTAPPGRGAWVAFAAGLGILAMLGSGGPRVDFSAHVFGLAVGALTGLLLATAMATRARPGRGGQWLAGACAGGVLLGCWGLA